MIRALLAFLVIATPAVARTGPMSFETGKLLPLTPGQWSYVSTADGSEASYGLHFSLRCDRLTNMVTIAWLDNRPAVSLRIATSSMMRDLPINGQLLANDPLLDAIAFSRGRILISEEGGYGPMLAIPIWPEVARIVEDCRN